MSVWVYRLNNNLWEEFHIIKWSFCLYFIIRFDDGTTIISFVLLRMKKYADVIWNDKKRFLVKFLLVCMLHSFRLKTVKVCVKEIKMKN